MTAEPTPSGPPAAVARPWLILATALGGVFATGVTVTLLSVSLVTIARDLHSTTGTLTWLVTGPMLGAAVVAAEEAGAAEDGAALRRIEGNCRLLSALRAEHRDLYALADARGLRGGDGGEALILRLLAGLAPLRLVLQTLVVEEELFARRPGEILAAVDAEDQAIHELSLHLYPFSCSFGGRNLGSLNL